MSPPPVRLPSPPQSPEPLVTSEGVNELDSLKKVNEEDAESGSLDLDSGDYFLSDCDTDEELYRPIFPDEILGDKACWKRYFEQIYESEGFDIKDYPGLGAMTTIFPMPHYLTNPSNVEEMKGFAAQALEQYNEKMGTAYEVNEILKVNGRYIQAFMYYITLSVKNGEHEYFQVEVVDDIYDPLDFPIVRPRAKGGLDI